MKKLFLVLFLIPFCFMKTAWASCTIQQPVDTVPMPLQLASLNAGNELAVGTNLYHQTYNLNFGSTFTLSTCTTGASQFLAIYSIYSTPSGGPLEIGTGPSGSTVYPTNIPGIGVYFWQGTNGLINIPGSKFATNLNNGGVGCANGTTCNVINNLKRWDMTFIKTGPISPGILQGSSLPCVQVNFNNTGSQSTSDGLVEQICFSGQVNIISSSCQTPDVVVNLGSHPTTEFSGTGSATDWVDSSIQLTNCPSSYGYGSNGNWYSDSSGTNGSGTPTNNRLGLKLSPNSGIVDATNGIFSVASGAGSAFGVGIQLAYGTTTSQSGYVNFQNEQLYPQTIGSSGNVTLPLVARYIQTDSAISSGQANGIATFTINYY